IKQADPEVVEEWKWVKPTSGGGPRPVQATLLRRLRRLVRRRGRRMAADGDANPARNVLSYARVSARRDDGGGRPIRRGRGWRCNAFRLVAPALQGLRLARRRAPRARPRGRARRGREPPRPLGDRLREP